MQILRTEENFNKAVHAAVEMLHEGGVIAFPTETTYGLGCDPRNRTALEAIYRIKGRRDSNALPLVACDLEQVRSAFDLSPAAVNVAKRYWPGAVTLLAPPIDATRAVLASILRENVGAIRVSSHSFVQAVTREFGFPITATSANISGQPPCLSGNDVIEAFDDQPQNRKPDLIIDGGQLPESQPSTIIRVFTDGKIEVIRQGAVTVEPL
jgi:L-threonylcarbamoyladenylate synthase